MSTPSSPGPAKRAPVQWFRLKVKPAGPVSGKKSPDASERAFPWKKVLAAAAVVLVAGGFTWYFVWGVTPEPPDIAVAPAASVRNYVASNDFKALPDERQFAYMKQLNDLAPERRREIMAFDNTTARDVRSQFRQNMRRVGERIQMKQAMEFYALSPEKRDQYLDDRMKEDQARRDQFRANRPPDSATGRPPAGGGGGPPRGFGRGGGGPDQRLQRGEQRLSDTTPQERAAMEYYRKMMQLKRAAARGKSG